jgi:hypothetical protein
MSDVAYKEKSRNRIAEMLLDIRRDLVKEISQLNNRIEEINFKIKEIDSVVGCLLCVD